MRTNSFQDVTIRYDEAGDRLIETLREIELNDQAETAYLKPGGVYWITGGMGGLGLIFTRHLMEEEADITIILTGRSALDEAGQQHLANLNEAKSTVVYLPADVSVKADVERVVQAISAEYGPLAGIIHSTGVIRDSFIINKTEAELEAVLAPKVTGLLNIDAVTQAEKLDFMVLFSSIVGVMGNIGQADYAAANTFVDAFAHHRQALVEAGERAGRTLAINWPLWAEGGMAVDEQTAAWLKQQMGLTALETSAGIRALTSGLSQPDLTQLLVTSGDRQKIRNQLQRMGQNQAAPPKQTVELTDEQQNHLFQATETYLKEQLSTALKLPSARMEHNAPWEKYGIDSVMVLNLTRQLEQSFGELPKTLFFEYQTLTDLTRYFVETYPSHLQKLLTQADQPTQTQPQTEPNLSPNSVRTRWLQQASPNKQALDLSQTEDIAIVGLSGRYPLAENLIEFWQNLKTGRDCISEIPQERWDHRLYFDTDKNKPGKSYSKWGGFVTDVDKFDPLFFNISPREAEMIDPQERLFLQTVWHTLEDAGYTRQTIQQQWQSRVGVFVGVMWGEYQLYGQDQLSLSSSYASIANRVSYYLNLHGPSLAIDTMCSSSLTSIHLACESIKRGECVAALAGGVN
ncbi:MAG: SDR family NAD(P)-dependent oxidoreductase, partial [Gammaproteobacteria bacterium]|nr:SDR family NAD(P)-dependent oxidoreductase [Gammaproteobacteria bacterium]